MLQTLAIIAVLIAIFAFVAYSTWIIAQYFIEYNTFHRMENYTKIPFKAFIKFWRDIKQTHTDKIYYDDGISFMYKDSRIAFFSRDSVRIASRIVYLSLFSFYIYRIILTSLFIRKKFDNIKNFKNRKEKNKKVIESEIKEIESNMGNICLKEDIKSRKRDSKM